MTITGGADSGSGISTYKYYLDGVLKGTTTSTSYTYTGLSSATNYTMSFEIVDNVGNIATSSKSVATSINIPTSLVATKGTTAQGRQITLNWNANGNTSNISYKVLGSTDNTTFTELGTVSGTSYTDGGIVLPNNNGGTTVTKYYKVQAVAPNGATSSETSSVSGNTLASPTVTASMDAPLNSGKNTINLSWNAVSGASGYKIAILDGQAYRHVDLGNVTSWNSDTAKIFPTTAQINAWDGTSNPFRLSGDGTTYPSDANVLYSKAERTTHHNHHYIVWIHVYSYDSASRASGGVQSGATNLSRTNPDRDAPSCAVSGGSSTWTKGNRTITGTCSDTGSGCTGNISYTYSSDINTTTAGAGGNNVGGTVTDNAGNSTTCLANQTVKVDKTAPTVTETYSGGMVFTDPNFSSGINGFTVYNNNKNGTVTQSREAVSNPWGSYVMRIVTNGSASPGLGGFAQRVTSRANATYIHIIRAKIPVGYTINYASNAVGDSPERYWLTPREGTGNWEEYSFVLKTSGTGTFSTFGHTYVSGPGTSVTWDVAYSTIIDTERKGISGNIVFRTTDVGSGYTHYGINQSSTTEPTYTSITNSSDLGVEKGGYTTNGTYYIWVKDAAGNVGKKSVSMTAVDTTPPTCVATKSNTGTTAGVTVTVTGTDYESGIVSGEVTDTGVKANKTYTVTNGVGLTGTCSVTVTSEIQYNQNVHNS